MKRSLPRLGTYILIVAVLISMIVLPASAFEASAGLSDSGSYQTWTQTDSRWAETAIGGSTIGRDGCVVTCLAMLAVGTGLKNEADFNPGTFAGAANFDSYGALYSNSVPNAVPGLSRVKSYPVPYGDRDSYANEVVWNLNEGRQVLAEVNGYHFVLVHHVSGNDIFICDPGYSEGVVSLYKRYAGVTHIMAYQVSGGIPANPVPPTIDAHVDGRSIVANWAGVSNATSYDVYLIQDPWDWNGVRRKENTTGTSLTFTDVVPGGYAVFVVSQPNDRNCQSNWVKELWISDTPAASYTVTVDRYLNGNPNESFRLTQESARNFLVTLPWGGTGGSFTLKNLTSEQTGFIWNGGETFIIENFDRDFHFSVYYDGPEPPVTGQFDPPTIWKPDEVAPTPPPAPNVMSYTIITDIYQDGQKFDRFELVSGPTDTLLVPMPTYDGFNLVDLSSDRRNCRWNGDMIAEITQLEQDVHLTAYYETKTPPQKKETGTDHFTYVNCWNPYLFEDILPGAWYYNDIKASYQMGLMKGTAEKAFAPTGSVTLAEAIALSSRLHSIYQTGSEHFQKVTPWYQCYVDYATENKLLPNEFSNYTVAATREEFSAILAAAFPAGALAPIRAIVPLEDIDLMNATYRDHVLLLYRAGVINGTGGNLFTPGAAITRAEAAAIVTRMADPATRLKS